MFTDGSGDDSKNLLQLFVNDGTKQINSMKIRDEKNCKVQFRNLPADSFFHFRVEYSEPKISVYWYDYEKDAYEFCTSIEQKLEF